MSSNLIRIFVNNQKLFTLSKFTTIHLFKQEIKKNVYNNLDNTNIILKYNNKVLQNNNTLYYYDIKDNDNIDVILPLRGGDYNSIEKTTKRLKFAYIPVWISTFIFFLTGFPLIISIIMISVFKKYYNNKFIKFLIQLAQIIFIFWFVIVSISIICIPVYSLFAKNCDVYKDSMTNGFYSAVLYILFYIIFFPFERFNRFGEKEKEEQKQEGGQNEFIQKTYNFLKTNHESFVSTILSGLPYQLLIKNGTGYFYDTSNILSKKDNLNKIKRWLNIDKIRIEEIIKGGGDDKLSDILVNSGFLKLLISQKNRDWFINNVNIDNNIYIFISNICSKIVNNIDKSTFQLAIQAGLIIGFFVILFTIFRIIWDLIWGLFT